MSASKSASRIEGFSADFRSKNTNIPNRPVNGRKPTLASNFWSFLTTEVPAKVPATHQ